MESNKGGLEQRVIKGFGCRYTGMISPCSITSESFVGDSYVSSLVALTPCISGKMETACIVVER